MKDRSFVIGLVLAGVLFWLGTRDERRPTPPRPVPAPQPAPAPKPCPPHRP